MGKSNSVQSENWIPFNRELSWLSFNARVLQEANDPTVPLIERIRFLAIFSNNLDEFFRVRVASVRRLIQLKKGDSHSAQRKQLKHTLESIRETVLLQQKEFDRIFSQEIVPCLKLGGVELIDDTQLNKTDKQALSAYFSDKIAPKLFPLMLRQGKPLPNLKDGEIYLAVHLFNSTTQSVQFALIEVPQQSVGRFIQLPTSREKTRIILLDDAIRFGLPELFSSLDFNEFTAHTIKITRDAELDIDNDIDANYVEQLRKSIKKRSVGDPTRFIYDKEIPADLLDFLMRRLNIDKDGAIPGGRYHNFRDFMSFPQVGPSEWTYPSQVPLHRPELDTAKSLLDYIENHDVLLNYPYESFAYVVRLMREAAIDPAVFAIHISVYRLAKDSSIASALINAVHNGKHVTIVVELQARFMEEENLIWARKLEEAGAKVIFGDPGFKVHSKLIAISRRKNFKTSHIVHIGTGNFNESTAKIYGDHSYLTARKRISSETLKVFEMIQNFKPEKFTFHQLWVSPVNTQSKLTECIEREINHHLQGKPARIVLKCNNLVDPYVINALYKAIAAQVPCDLIIRGICTLTIQTEWKHVRAISIVDRYLEHARLYYFQNDNKPILMMGSADIMQRNLRHRVEVCMPVLDKTIKATLVDVLNLQLADNTKARSLEGKQRNKKVALSSSTKTLPEGHLQDVASFSEPIQSQQRLRQYFEKGLA